MDLAALSKTIKDMKDKLDVIFVALIGDPTDESKPGVIIRLDRLERAYRTLVWFGSAMVTLTAAIIAAFVIKLI
ncbi:hypothetical protein LCGC14_2190310 [marine sediment metagenome]|uniref:Uncharacterized protein n=1 Tax=marine sediment metagenome TaxID=412755 RepID=A0A0F9DJS1_9ZZZZ